MTFSITRYLSSESLTVAVEELQSVLDSVACPQAVHLLLLLNEGDEGGPLNLHGLARPDHDCHEVIFVMSKLMTLTCHTAR